VANIKSAWVDAHNNARVSILPFYDTALVYYRVSLFPSVLRFSCGQQYHKH